LVTGLGCVPNSRVESSPVRLTKTLQTLFGTLIMAAHRNTYTLAESSPMNFAKSRVVVLHVAFLSVGLQYSA